jgi:hypothetical protein
MFYHYLRLEVLMAVEKNVNFLTGRTITPEFSVSPPRCLLSFILPMYYSFPPISTSLYPVSSILARPPLLHLTLFYPADSFSPSLPVINFAIPASTVLFSYSYVP